MGASRRGLWLLALVVVAAGAVGLLVWGIDDGDDGGASGGAASGEQGTPVSALRCADWSEASTAERFDTIAQVEEFAGGPVTGEGVAGRGSVLTRDQAYSLFERQCEPKYAANFALYKLYTQATGFAGQPPEE